ncbi:hypothetical protein K0T92_01815 [Paenibacillus oenotherae]|uniref:Uncharacterized protein n=1 Tax=Paenibacillus oenotherae TaxID=1435645 RepID=A0ABS7D0S4_9BACL|nr:hypothetical protein [Paenibacillus oenotherae]MBW7473478.1 hypothetical protein [Paenibacillus oenotherae]
MRWTGFLLGSLAGMAAAAYVAKKRPGMFAWATAACTSMATGLKGRTIDAVISRKLGSKSSSASASTSAKEKGAAPEDSAAAWGQIEMLMNSDPTVKREAERIAAEGKAH